MMASSTRDLQLSHEPWRNLAVAPVDFSGR